MATSWSCFEDFNVIHSSSEDFGGYPSLREMEEFDGALLEADLVELEMTGNWFTWTSKIQGNGILRRLDHCLSNEAWKVAFPYSEVRVGQWGISDHNPLLVSTGETRSRPPPTFRYFSHWAEAEGFIDIISFVQNLKAVKRVLRASFGRHISVLADEVRAARQVMEVSQMKIERDPNLDSVCVETARATEVFWSVARLEEASLRQKVRVSCSGLFTVVDAGETRQMVHDRVARVAVDFFRGYLRSQPVGYRDLTARIEDIVQFSWSEEGVEALGRPMSWDEIKKALFSMKSGKAPGMMGFQLIFTELLGMGLGMISMMLC
ncbi:uncharacterized protein LOC120067439 [Benincasa hispida]|uniref:uncharacterized protein LOC120067439 n=1 Tax=Benincasa hispida TaxID=102211 RepID=UPI0019025B81|nr:uncharacterized protein LOC120067439 [Benincasa hispida]